MKTVILSILILFITINAMAQEGFKPRKIAFITVKAGEFERNKTPLSCIIDGVTLNEEETLILNELNGSKRTEIPVQIESRNPLKVWWILDRKLNPNQMQTFELAVGRETVAFREVLIDKDDKAIRLKVFNRKVLQYNYATIPAPEGQSELYARGGFIHPVWAPDGEVLTAIQPKDHFHHLGLWNPWTLAEFEGRTVDFWNLKDGKGTVKFAGFDSLTIGTVYGGFKALQKHIDLKAPEGEKTAINEQFKIRVFNIGEAESGPWLWEINSTMQCASESPVLLKEYRYGGLGYRATQKWNTANSEILTSEGKKREDSDGTRGKWCLISGPTEKARAGMLFVDHPGNYNAPEPMRVWPPDANGGKENVFFNFCPVKDRDWLLEPHKSYTLKYRVMVFEGKPDTVKAEQIWQDFANPPEVMVRVL